MFEFIKRLFKKKKEPSCSFFAEDVKGNKIVIENKTPKKTKKKAKN